MILKHIPNALTVTRLVLIVPFLVFLYQHKYTHAFYIFLLAGFTDGLDGWLARYFRWQSSFGLFLDPLADKLLIASSFIALALSGKLPWWLVILVFSRDITISIGVVCWYWFIRREPQFHPSYLSKVNTVLQLTLVTVCLFEQAFPQFSSNLIHITQTILVLTTLTTAGSFVDYVWTWGKKACATANQAR